MIGDMARAVLAQNEAYKPILSRALIRTDGKPLEPGDSPVTNPLCRLTNFYYYIKYRPSLFTKYKDKPFVLVADVLQGGKIRFKTRPELDYIAEREPCLKWLLSNCPVTHEMIKVAGQNMEFPIMLPFDVAAYNEKLKSQMKDCSKGDKYWLSSFKEPDQARADVILKKQWREEKNRKLKEQ